MTHHDDDDDPRGRFVRDFAVAWMCEEVEKRELSSLWQEFAGGKRSLEKCKRVVFVFLANNSVRSGNEGWGKVFF